MMNDPIVSEIHKVREDLARRLNDDIHAIGNYLREQQTKSKRPVVDLSKTNKANQSLRS